MIQSTINYRQGDVILVPFPFTDLSTVKQRPAVIISSDLFNADSLDIIAAAITSNISSSSNENEFMLSADDLHKGGLPKASLVKLGKIVTIDKRLIRKNIGRLSKETMVKIIRLVHQHILSNPS